MTCERLDPEHWRLTFDEPEALFIVNVLARLGRHYMEDIDQMPPALKAYWKGTISRGAGKDEDLLEEEQQLLADARADLRSERLGMVENWIRDFELAESRNPWAVEINATEREEFVAMLNDRRLALAHQSGISEQDMQRDLEDIEDEARRMTVLEIDMLGQFILNVLGPQIYRP